MRIGPLLLTFKLLLTGIARCADPSYTPAALDKLVSSGLAREHGARFANQGLGCETFLWKELDRHHLFVLRRDGVSYGEFRDEVLLQGRYLSVIEQYLVADAREREVLSKSKVLRFVRKHELLVWKDEVCIGATTRWSFLSTGLDGTDIKREAVVEKRIVRGVISVIFPDRFTPEGETFEVGLERKCLTLHEIAFGSDTPVIETFGLSNRRCSILAQRPHDDPEWVVTLDTPKDPRDSLPGFQTKRVASMAIRLDPPANVPFVFVPAPESLRSTNDR